MKEIIKENPIYVSDDGIEFDNIQECIAHEQANAFSKDMEKILKVKNIPFVNGMLVDGYWCKNQFDLDCCINWWTEAQKNIGRTCTTKSVFLQPDYYFILLDVVASDIQENKYAYNFLPYAYLQKQWDNFTKLIPSDPYAYNVMQEIRNKYNNFKLEKKSIESNNKTLEKKDITKSSPLNKEDLLNKLNKRSKIK